MSEIVYDIHVQVWLCAFCLLAVWMMNYFNQNSPPSHISLTVYSTTVSMSCVVYGSMCVFLCVWRGVFKGKRVRCLKWSRFNMHSPSMECSVLNQGSGLSQSLYWEVMHHMWMMSRRPGDLFLFELYSKRVKGHGVLFLIEALCWSVCSQHMLMLNFHKCSLLSAEYLHMISDSTSVLLIIHPAHYACGFI